MSVWLDTTVSFMGAFVFLLVGALIGMHLERRHGRRVYLNEFCKECGNMKVRLRLKPAKVCDCCGAEIPEPRREAP